MKALTLVLLALFSLNAHAWKGMGGGGGSTSTGTTLDLDEAKNLTAIDKVALANLVATEVPSRLAELPQLKFLVNRTIQSKYWNLSSVPLNPACQNKSLALGTPEVIGCQTSLEVRILQSWWVKAPRRERAAIVLHEALLAYFENTPYESEVIRPVVASLMSNQPLALVRDAFRVSKFGFLATADDVRGTSLLIRESSAQLCREGKLASIDPWIAKLPAYMNPVIHCVRDTFEAEYQALGQTDFCSTPPESNEAWALQYWMLENPLPLWWLDRDGVGKRDIFRIWTLLQPL